MRLLNSFLQRLVIFGLGVFSVWLIVFVVFDTADRRLPWILAVGLTYGIAAYVILPRIIRMGLKLLHRKRVPSFIQRAMDCRAIPSTWRSSERSHSFARPLQPSAGRRRTG